MLRKLLLLLICVAAGITSYAQRKPVYHSCFLMDSVDKNLEFIRLNASRIFTDSVDCKQTLLDSIAIHYTQSKDKKYLDVLSSIRQNPNAKVENNYTDIIKRFIENDFSGFIKQLYLSKGKYYVLEKELIGTMNMIVDGRPYKQKYMGLLNVDISIAKDKKDTYYQSFLEKLKVKIEEEKY
ncbi:MAG: hypothetical protein U0V74_02000 [Chitinophagales bacterium]